MAQTKCRSCGYPYATVFKCPNCGLKNPGAVNLKPHQKKAVNKFIFIIIGGIIIISIFKALEFDFKDYEGHIIIGLIAITMFYLVNKANKKH